MKSQTKIKRVMHEFKEGELKSHGKRVTNRKQAIAIAMSEAGIKRKAKACAGMAVPLVVLEAGGILGEYYDLRIPIGSGEKSEAISRVINSAFYNNKGKLDKERMDKTIKALAKKNDKAWMKEWNDYKKTMEVEVDNGKYINPFTVHHFMKSGGGIYNRGGTTGGRGGGSDLPDNYYVYKWYEERGHLTMSVEDKGNNYLWEYDNENDGTSPVDDGFMENLDDTDGLEKYLIDLKVLPSNAVLIDENTALQKYEHYKRGGIIAEVKNFFTAKTSLKEIFG